MKLLGGDTKADPKGGRKKSCLGAKVKSSPSSICDNQVLTSSDESPGHTIPIRS